MFQNVSTGNAKVISVLLLYLHASHCFRLLAMWFADLWFDSVALSVELI